MPYKDPEKQKEYNKKYGEKYRIKNAEKIKFKMKIYRLKNKDKRNQYDKEYYLKNKDKRIKNKIEYDRIRLKNDLDYKLRKYCRTRINYVLKNNVKSNRTMELVGCSTGFLKKYLESKFESWMNWDNYGVNGWHIDHIIPCASFDLKCPVQQLACFHFSNLQPLEATKNLKKGAKLNYEVEQTI